ncbi:MAG: RNA polymerase sigma-70 factor [Aquaticitalea sp.]
MKEAFENENLLLYSFKRGEEEGFSYYFKVFYPSLCYFSNSIIRDEAAAEDIATEAFIKLWEKRDVFESVAHVKSFLYKVVRNASIDFLRKREKAANHLFEQCYLGEEKERSIQEKIIAAETFREVVASIKLLPPKCRLIFRMFYFEGKDYSQIAKELGLSVNTIRVQKARALAILRQHPGLTLFFLASFALVC